MSMKTPEDRVKDSVIDYLDTLIKLGYPIYYERRQAIGPSYKLGLPDLWMIVNGHHLELELKADGGERSAAQIRWEERFRRINCQYLCAFTVNDVKAFLEANYGIR